MVEDLKDIASKTGPNADFGIDHKQNSLHKIDHVQAPNNLKKKKESQFP